MTDGAVYPRTYRFAKGGARVKPFQLKHLDERLVLVAIRNAQTDKHPLGATLDDLMLGLGAPWNMARALAQRLIGRGLATGCACGCRADLRLTPEGERRLTRLNEPWRLATSYGLLGTEPREGT